MDTISDNEGELCAQTINDIQEAREEIAAGKSVTLEKAKNLRRSCA